MTLPVVVLPPAQLPALATAEDWVGVVGAEPIPGGLELELAAASAAIRRWCRWHVSPILTETVVLDGPGGRCLMLPTMRLVEVVSITETVRGLGQVPGVIDLAGCEATEKGWVYRDRNWTRRLGGLAVKYRHGYAAHEVPELTSLVASMVARGLDSSGVEQATVGQVSVRFTRTEGATSPGYSIIGGTVDPYYRPV